MFYALFCAGLKWSALCPRPRVAIYSYLDEYFSDRCLDAKLIMGVEAVAFPPRTERRTGSPERTDLPWMGGAVEYIGD